MKSLLKNAREKKGLKTRELAQLANIDQALISKFESGTRKPTKDQIIKLSELLEIDYETLMIVWLKEKILYEIGGEEFALKALLLAEQEIQNNTEKINSSLLSSIQVVLDEIEKLRIKIQNFNHFELRQISKTLEVEFIFKSIQLNGNSLTLEETKSVLNDGLTFSEKSIQDHLEAVNFQEATIYTKDLIQKKTAFNEKDFLSLHNLILKGIELENLGKYKNDPIIIREINLFFTWYEANKNLLHPIILGAESFIKITEISPFEKDTLQMANLALNWILVYHKYFFINIQENYNNEKSIFTNYILQKQKEVLIRAIELVSK
jgi:transcriptional regulator with XRE-family HTH domain